MKPKIKIGDFVWIIEQFLEEDVECPVCKGTGQVIAKTKDLSFSTSCPICCSRKTIEVPVWGFQYSDVKEIVGIAKEKNDDGEIVTYLKAKGRWEGYGILQENVFLSRKEAEIEIKRRNKYAVIQKIEKIKKDTTF